MGDVDSGPIISCSQAQRSAWDHAVLPDPEEVEPGLWAFGIPIPGGHIPHTLCYAIIGADGVHVIDPGWSGDEALAALARGLAAAGVEVADVVSVIATHHHPDHLGLAARLRAHSGARVIMSAQERRVLGSVTAPAAHDAAADASRLEEWGVPQARREELLASFDRPSLIEDMDPDLAVGEGDILTLAKRRLEVVATPGHTDGHICLVDRDAGLLFSGDHVLPQIYSGVGIGTLPGADPIGDLLDSLDRIGRFDGLQVLPGHEYRFRGLAARCAQISSHHLRRTAEVASLLPMLGTAPIWEYASRMTWTGGWGGMHGFHLASALTQTRMHRDFIRSGRAGRYGVSAAG